MARNEICVIGLILTTMILAMPPASASSLSDLKSQVSSFNDPHITTNDLAFYLSSHGYDATPKGNVVEVNLGSNTYKLTPNHESVPGLATIAA